MRLNITTKLLAKSFDGIKITPLSLSIECMLNSNEPKKIQFDLGITMKCGKSQIIFQNTGYKQKKLNTTFVEKNESFINNTYTSLFEIKRNNIKKFLNWTNNKTFECWVQCKSMNAENKTEIINESNKEKFILISM